MVEDNIRCHVRISGPQTASDKIISHVLHTASGMNTILSEYSERLLRGEIVYCCLWAGPSVAATFRPTLAKQCPIVLGRAKLLRAYHWRQNALSQLAHKQDSTTVAYIQITSSQPF